MGDREHLQAAIEATRSQLKATQRAIRTSLQFLADLEEQLAAETAQPNERHSDGNGHQTAHGRLRITA